VTYFGHWRGSLALVSSTLLTILKYIPETLKSFYLLPLLRLSPLLLWPSPLRRQRRSGTSTKRNRLSTHGISGAEGRPAVPSTWRRQAPLTQSRSSGFRLVCIAMSMGVMASRCCAGSSVAGVLEYPNIQRPGALDERQHRPDVRVTKLHAVCGHIGFIARYDPGGAVLDHLEQLPVRMVP